MKTKHKQDLQLEDMSQQAPQQISNENNGQQNMQLDEKQQWE